MERQNELEQIQHHTQRIPELVANADKTIQEVYQQVIEHDSYVKEANIIREHRINEEDHSRMAKRLLWLSEHAPQLRELHQCGIYIGAHVYGFLVNNLSIDDLDKMSELDQSSKVASITNDPDFKIVTYFSDLIELAQDKNKLQTISHLYQQFGLSFSPDDCGFVAKSFLQADPQKVNNMTQFVETAMRLNIIASIDDDALIPPIKGRMIYDMLGQHWSNSRFFYESGQSASYTQKEDEAMSSLGESMRLFRQNTLSKANYRFTYFNQIILDSLAKWSKMPESFHSNCLALNIAALETVERVAHSCVHLDSHATEVSMAYDLVVHILQSNDVSTSVSVIENAQQNMNELVAIYKQVSEYENARISPPKLYTWAQIVQYPKETRDKALGFLKTHGVEYYRTVSESDVLNLVIQISRLEDTESKIIAELSSRYTQYSIDEIAHVVRETHFGVVSKWYNVPLLPSDYAALERVLAHPDKISARTSVNAEYWFNARDFCSHAEELFCAWKYPQDREVGELDYHTGINEALERICEQSPDSSVLPHEGCVIGTTEIEGNTMILVHEEDSIAAYCKITEPFGSIVMKTIEQLPHDKINYFSAINRDKGKLSSVGYSTEAYLIELGGCTISYVGDPVMGDSAVKNALRIEIPDNLDAHAMFLKLAHIMEQIGLSREVLLPPSTQHEEEYKKRRFQWLHRRDPTQEEWSSLVRREVLDGYSTVVDPNFLSRNKILPSDFVLTHTAYSSSTIPSVLTHGLLSEHFAVRKGIPSLGITFKPFNDMQTGFADSTGVRIYHRDQLLKTNKLGGDIAVQLYISPSVLNRTDWYWYHQDSQGITFGSLYENRPTGEEAVAAIRQAFNQTNEAMFRMGIAPEDILFLSVKTQENRNALLTQLHEQSINTVGGRPIEEVIIVADTWQDFLEIYPQQIGMQIQEKEMRRLDAMLKRSEQFSPAKAIELLRRNTVLEKYFDTELCSSSIYGENEDYTVEKHTGMVLTNFEKLQNRYQEQVLSKAGMRFALLVHDLGKGVVLQEGQSTHKHHMYNKEICTALIGSSDLSEREKNIVIHLVSQDILGEFLQSKVTKDEASEQIQHIAKEIDIPAIDLFTLINTYTLCDIAAYTSYARYTDSSGNEQHGILSLDHLVEVSEQGIWFQDVIEDKLQTIQNLL